uniref:hypothetical protein n=1 Tax=[Clostridium] aminophilum TaxID=1526 RepID=UPI0033307E30
KQTKYVAVLSAAALLAMGASMTSFAAGWEKDEAGAWHYYDKDDDMVTNEWKKDGGKWFYLDDDGNMATNQWVDDDYYVGEDGAMLTNQWVKALEDTDDEDDPTDTGEHWYYFGAKGKKFTSSDSNNGKKTIGNKTYFFDGDGKMMTGWHQFGNDVYYLGGEDEGWAAKNRWLWLEKSSLTKDDDDETASQDVLDCSDGEDDKCDDEGWYWFDGSGKLYYKSGLKTINGRKFLFNDHGQMLYEWIYNNGYKKGSNASLDGEHSGASINKMLWFQENGDGASNGSRYKGWQYISGSEDVKTDGDTNWYYFKDGEAKYADKVNGLTDDGSDLFRKKEKLSWDGKSGTFCFDQNGKMKTGLQWIEGHTYFFNDDGYMQTGKVANVEEANGDSFNYSFETKNSGKGQGLNKVKDGFLYFNGKRIEADDDYKIYRIGSKYYVVNNKGKAQKALKNKTLEIYDPHDGKATTLEKAYLRDEDGKIGKDYYITDGTTPILTKKEGDSKPSATGLTVADVACVPHIQLDDTDNYILGVEVTGRDNKKYSVLDKADTEAVESLDWLTVQNMEDAIKEANKN